ncbi:uncharacterized protein LOC126966581 [Leptidea sinapis]|uniref:uncharacterized protein LOC126966581 n=1 Tax=Leptidea sinapis TaxID=189913 RepID=UPI0021275771|nr:uncharacterized protein LOC126966581 [Leptidea sinapis]
MENKQPSCKKSLVPDEKLKRKVYHDAIAGQSNCYNKPLFLEIVHKGPHKNDSQKVLVSIKPRTPAIKTLYVAEKCRFRSKKHSVISGSQLAIGDHSSFTSRITQDESSVNNDINCLTKHSNTTEVQYNIRNSLTNSVQAKTTISTGNCTSENVSQDVSDYNTEITFEGYFATQPCPNTNKLETVNENSKVNPYKVKLNTVIANTCNTSENIISPSIENLININRRIDSLERKIVKQEMVVRSLSPHALISSSEDDEKANKAKSPVQHPGSPGCSYVEYSHIPGTSAFQRYAQAAPLSPSKATTIQKEHNSEQYGRDFTLYDGITSRGRRQCASVPCKRDEVPKVAAERVHKIRHKLNPVRDYRLMDTVHYLAQGEFAPRDDGIKLTPSREAVLSDIIWEDVCRTHWPNTRLARRLAHSERCGTRSDLQRLIDSLLRERIAHVERRRRRHYRIVKLNNRHENCRPVGKTGDIIVASHKSRHENDDRDSPISEHTKPISLERRNNERRPCKTNKSQEQLMYAKTKPRRKFNPEQCTAGPSYAKRRSSPKTSTCCYTSKTVNKKNMHAQRHNCSRYDTSTISGSSVTTGKVHPKHPRLVVKKSSGRRKYQVKEPNLEHFILLPTLVVRTPSNMKRQKKFNELYHRILNVQTEINDGVSPGRTPKSTMATKDIGFNVNINISDTSYGEDAKE